MRTEAVIVQVLEWISAGKTLRSFCRQPGKPARITIDKWRESDQAFDIRFARARALGADEIAEQCLQIADTPVIGRTTTTDIDGVSTKTEDALGHRKLQIETRLKLLAVWDRRYSAKSELAGAGGSPLIPIPPDPVTVAAKIASILAAAEARIATDEETDDGEVHAAEG